MTNTPPTHSSSVQLLGHPDAAVSCSIEPTIYFRGYLDMPFPLSASRPGSLCILTSCPEIALIRHSELLLCVCNIKEG